MVRQGRPTEDLVLSDDERQTLERWARRPNCAQSTPALRCRIVLECAKGRTNTRWRTVSGHPGHGGQVASAFRRAPPRGAP